MFQGVPKLDVKRLRWLVLYACKYYFRNKEPLTTHLTLAATRVVHLLALQHECHRFDDHWYCDPVEELGGVLGDVQEQGINFLGSEYFICLKGNDHQENAIGVVRLACGHVGNAGSWILHNAAGASLWQPEIGSIFAEGARCTSWWKECALRTT